MIERYKADTSYLANLTAVITGVGCQPPEPVTTPATGSPE